MKETADEATVVSHKRDKVFYLYQNEALQRVAKSDLEALLPYVSARVKDKVNLGLHYMGLDSTA